MNDFLKYTSPNWNEVLTEQADRNSVCSGNSRTNQEIKMRKILIEKYPSQKDYVKFMDLNKLYETEYKLENYGNPRLFKKFERIKKWGHPKKCPAMNHITNLIIF